MKEAIETLNHAIQEARQAIDHCTEERAYWDEKRRQAYRQYYQAKDQLNQLTTQTNAAH